MTVHGILSKIPSFSSSFNIQFKLIPSTGVILPLNMNQMSRGVNYSPQVDTGKTSRSVKKSN